MSETALKLLKKSRKIILITMIAMVMIIKVIIEKSLRVLEKKS